MHAVRRQQPAALSATITGSSASARPPSTYRKTIYAQLRQLQQLEEETIRLKRLDADF